MNDKPPEQSAEGVVSHLLSESLKRDLAIAAAVVIKSYRDKIVEHERVRANEKASLAALRASCVNKCHHPEQFIGEWEDGSRHCWECEYIRSAASRESLKRQLDESYRAYEIANESASKLQQERDSLAAKVKELNDLVSRLASGIRTEYFNPELLKSLLDECDAAIANQKKGDGG